MHNTSGSKTASVKSSARTSSENHAVDDLSLVTGGAGFIGSYLVEELVHRGRRVRVLDDFSTGLRGNISHLHNVEVIEGTLTDLYQPKR